MYICYMNYWYDYHHKDVVIITESEEKARTWCDEFETVYSSGDVAEWRSYRIAVIDEVIDDLKDDDYNTYDQLFEKMHGKV